MEGLTPGRALVFSLLAFVAVVIVVVLLWDCLLYTSDAADE